MGEFKEYADLYAAIIALGFVTEAVRIAMWAVAIYIAVRRAIEHSTQA